MRSQKRNHIVAILTNLQTLEKEVWHKLLEIIAGRYMQTVSLIKVCEYKETAYKKKMSDGLPSHSPNLG